MRVYLNLLASLVAGCHIGYATAADNDCADLADQLQASLSLTPSMAVTTLTAMNDHCPAPKVEYYLARALQRSGDNGAAAHHYGRVLAANGVELPLVLAARARAAEIAYEKGEFVRTKCLLPQRSNYPDVVVPAWEEVEQRLINDIGWDDLSEEQWLAVDECRTANRNPVVVEEFALLFGTAEATIKPGSRSETKVRHGFIARAITGLVKRNVLAPDGKTVLIPRTALVLTGFADQRGNRHANQLLSFRRADIVRRLMEAHAPALTGLIRAEGLGETNRFGTSLVLNRRVELRFD